MIMKAAAEPSTERFLVPLSANRIAALQKRLKRVDSDALNEGILSAVDPATQIMGSRDPKSCHLCVRETGNPDNI